MYNSFFYFLPLYVCRGFFVPVFFSAVVCFVLFPFCQGGLHQWAKEFSERPRDSCPQFVSRRLTLLLDLGEPKQKRRMLEVCGICVVQWYLFSSHRPFHPFAFLSLALSSARSVSVLDRAALNRPFVYLGFCNTLPLQRSLSGSAQR